MPMIRLQLSISLSREQQTEMMARLSKESAKQLGKPEQYMMVIVESETSILMSGRGEPAAFAEVRSVGTITGDQAKALTRTISDLLTEVVNIPADRVYLNFMGVSGPMWGFDGSTFG